MVRCIAEGYCWYCWMNLDKALQKIIDEGNINFFVSTFVDLQDEKKKKILIRQKKNLSSIYLTVFLCLHKSTSH